MSSGVMAGPPFLFSSVALKNKMEAQPLNLNGVFSDGG
jgi:hypothetical protein